MAPDPATAKTFAALVQKTAKIEKARKALDPKLDDIFKKARAAIDAKDRTMMQFFTSALEGEVTAIGALIQDVDSAVGSLTEIEFDEDFVAAHEAEVEKAAKIVSESRTNLTKQFQTAKRLQNETEKAWVGADKTEEQMLRNLASLDKDVKGAIDAIKVVSKKVDAAWKKAQDAFDARNAKALADAQKAFEGMTVDVDLFMFATYSKSLDELEKKSDDASFSADLKADLKDGIKDLRILIKANSIYVEQIEKAQKEVPALEVEAIDAKKALEVLELDKKFDKKLAAILNGPAGQMEAALGKLLKEAKLEMTGKDAKEALKKAGVI